MTDAYAGSWAKTGMIHRGVPEPEPVKVLCRVCGGPSPVGLCRPCQDSTRERVHGSHNGFNQHKWHHELPCQECSKAEKVYQGARGKLSGTNRRWADRNAVAHSWRLAERHARLTNTTE